MMEKMQENLLDERLKDIYDNTQDLIIETMRFFMFGIIKK